MVGGIRRKLLGLEGANQVQTEKEECWSELSRLREEGWMQKERFNVGSDRCLRFKEEVERGSYEVRGAQKWEKKIYCNNKEVGRKGKEVMNVRSEVKKGLSVFRGFKREK